ncbi:glycosyltransferase family 9 protein [Alteromonas sp. SM 2104]|nr:glycosyltransferase family 9 protein [Alteromonas oceanisediminis]
MVQAIQLARPDVRITWVIGKIEHQFLRGLPGVEFVEFDKKQGATARKALKHRLAGKRFDVLFMMQVALRANWVSRSINARYRLGFDHARSKELHSLFINRRIAPQPYAHVLEGFMGFAQAVGVPTPNPVTWKMPITEDDIAYAQTLNQAWGDYVVICPAASKAERCWLPERYAAVADHLHNQGIRTVLCGSPAALDTRLGEAICAQTSISPHNLIGKTSLKQLLAVLANARCVLAPDTGPAHMATTVGTPVVGLYAHSNPRRTGPYHDISRVVSVYDQVVEAQYGKHWRALAWGKRAKGDDLMQRIEVSDVIRALETLFTAE